MNANETIYVEIGTRKKEDIQIEENTCYGKIVSKPAKVVHDDGKNHLSKVVLSLLLLVVLALLLGVVGACVALGLEIAKLKSETASLDSRQQVGQNGTEIANLNMLYQQLILNYSAIEARFDSFYKQTSQNYSATEFRFRMLHQQFGQNISAAEDLFSQQLGEDHSEFCNLIQQLNSSIQLISQQMGEGHSKFHNLIQQLNVSTQLIVNNFIETTHGQSILNPAASCAALPPSSPSGYYWVWTSNGSPVRVYCDMTRSCDRVTGGWVRVAELDMTNSSHQCPSGLRQPNINRRTCVKIGEGSGCSSLSNFITNYNIQYSMICGRIIAYQYSSPDAFVGNNINSVYVDGVSLTHGNPRQHIWSFAAARDETEVRTCPCLDGNPRTGRPPPTFVGNDYFCDTGSSGVFTPGYYFENPLWDGAGCGSRSTCYSFNNPPWFYKQLPRPTTDGIEMRVCRNSDVSNEDVAIAIVDMYIQ